MKKKIFFSILLILALLLSTSIAYAVDDNSMLENATNGVRNMVGGAENAVEGAVKGVGNTVRDMGHAIGNSGREMGNTTQNITNGMMSTNNFDDSENAMNDDDNDYAFGATNGNENYTATRTATTGEDSTIFGLTTNTWTWMIVLLSVLAIGILIYSYFAQNNNTHYENSDE